MSSLRSASITLNVARGSAALALVTLLTLAARAWRSGEAGEDALGEHTPRASLGRPSAPRAPVETGRLIAHDPFSPVRSAPDVPYRIANASTPAIAAEAARPVRLLGTVVRPLGRSFAMCQLGAEQPRMVYQGDKIGNLTLQSVAQGSAVFSDGDGKTVVLQVPRSGG